MSYEVVKSSFDSRDFTLESASNLPATFSLDDLPDVKNQGSKPTCAAHALSSIVEYHNYKNTQQKEVFSTEFIYGLREEGYYIGDGMMLRDGLKTIQHYGDVYRVDCPGNNDYEKAMENVNERIEEYKEAAKPHKVEAYFRLHTNGEIKTAIYKYGPVIANIKTYKNAKIKDDLYTYDEDDEYGYHAVMIYGWTEDAWLVQNSWGKLYAGDGRFKLPLYYRMAEVWGVADTSYDTDIKLKPNSWIRRLLNRVINFIFDLLKIF